MELLKAWNGNDKMFKTLLDKLKLKSTREMESQSNRNDFQDVEEGIKTCPNCGDVNYDDYNFCVNCGFPLKGHITVDQYRAKLQKQSRIRSSRFDEKFARDCVAYCEFDKTQNNKTPGLDGNFRFNDRRFDDYAEQLTKSNIPDELLIETSEKISNTYMNFGVYIRIQKVKVTEQYVIFEIIPDSSTKVKSILKLENEISLALKTDVIINPIYQKGFIALIISTRYYDERE